MAEYVQRGAVIDFTPDEDIELGEVVVVKDLVGIACHSIAADTLGALAVDGVFDFPKGNAAFEMGDQAFWNAGATQATDQPNGGVNKLIGTVTRDAASGDATVRIRLAGHGMAPHGVTSLRVARGQHTTIAEVDTIVTGLTSVAVVVVQMDDDPVDGAMFVTASVGNQAGAPAAGSVYVKTWKNTDADSTLVAATTFGKRVNWVAYGT